MKKNLDLFRNLLGICALSFYLIYCGMGISSQISVPSLVLSLNPTSGPIGSLVYVRGTGPGLDFGGVQEIALGGVSPILLSQSTSELTLFVMPGTVSGTLSLSTLANGALSSSPHSFTVTNLSPPATQQGSKLVGTGNVGSADQGFSVALSADGNTALVGGRGDNTGQGATWVFIRSGTTWSQQGSKLVGSGNTGAAQQGTSVALSADGNTALVGGWANNGAQGGVWVFTRSGTTWSQQAGPLVGTGNTGAARQGYAVALSADGNTALIGGYGDNTLQGAAWIFTRSGTTWTQQGSKLVGSGNIGSAQQGYAVALSSDGNTALIGGYQDNSSEGAGWIFVRNGSTWTQQGSKLYGTGTVSAQQGVSVALSADGNTALMGGWQDSSDEGATWVFVRSGTTWSQQGSKLVGTGGGTAGRQGSGISISADGNTAVIGGYFDNSSQGATWVFKRSNGVWTQQGNKLVGTGNVGGARQGYKVSLSSDGTTALSGGYLDNGNQGAAWVFVP